MAQMIPNQPVDGSPQSENTVFEVLEKLPADWIVIHSKRFILPGRQKGGEYEVDFIIFNPKRGYLGLEVKGGQEVGRDGQGWYSVDHFGQKHRLNKDPGVQAQSAVHQVSRYLQRFPDFAKWQIPYGWGVCLPGVTVHGDLDSSLPRGYVIDKSGLANIKASLDEVFDANGLPVGLIPNSKIQAFLKALAPCFKLAPSLASRFDDERTAMVQLTSEQNDVLDMFEEFPRVAVKGAAGTGKTLVAMEKARRLASEDKRVLFLCFNRPLADHLAGRSDGFVVETFHKFAKDMAQRAGIPFKEPKDESEKDQFWNEDVADLLLQALNVYPDERYDAVIVDEAQDFKPLWWLPVESLLRNKDEGTLYVFYDPNQQIYGGGPAEELGLKATSLKYNCRNTQHIAEHSSELVGIEPLLRPGTPTGADVITRACSDERDMVDQVRKLLHEFVSVNKIETDRIVILTTGRAQLSPVYKAGKLGNVKLVPLSQQPNRDEVRFSTLHRFKGLEADIVILCDVKPGDEQSAPKHLYVATSRACHLLAVCRYSN